jgi:hypothetical protein
LESDLNKIESIASAAHATVGNELAFTYPEVLDVVRQCTAHGIAVLGVEVFVVRPEGYQTEHLSTYDLYMQRAVQKSEWASYVAGNNLHASEFVSTHPSGDDHVYVLTTASWTEFRATKLMR